LLLPAAPSLLGRGSLDERDENIVGTSRDDGSKE
jgi:hypothetical protein